MRNPTIREIIDTVESRAPLSLQESYDNSGVQVSGGLDAECSGVLLTFDHTPEAVAEAVERGCNLVIAHHPIIFRPLKRLVGETASQRTVMAALRAGVTLYSAHTNLDNAPGGVSIEMARRLGLENVEVLAADASGHGSGAVGYLAGGRLPAGEFVAMVKERLGAEVARCSRFDDSKEIGRVALCGGAGGSFIDDAVRSGADVYVTGDVRYHDFQERADDILLVDIGHYETEQCSSSIFLEIIKEKFPTFAVQYSKLQQNPIVYL